MRVEPWENQGKKSLPETPFAPHPPISLNPPGNLEVDEAIPRRCLRSVLQGLGLGVRRCSEGASPVSGGGV